MFGSKPWSSVLLLAVIGMTSGVSLTRGQLLGMDAARRMDVVG
jgi:hypothetical protein